MGLSPSDLRAMTIADFTAYARGFRRAHGGDSSPAMKADEIAALRAELWGDDA